MYEKYLVENLTDWLAQTFGTTEEPSEEPSSVDSGR